MSSANSRRAPGFEIQVMGAQVWDPQKDNLDVEIRFDHGPRYVATFFTIENIRALFDKNKSTGECRNGLYLWSTDMIIVQELTLDSIRNTVSGLIESGELEAALTRID